MIPISGCARIIHHCEFYIRSYSPPKAPLSLHHRCQIIGSSFLTLSTACVSSRVIQESYVSVRLLVNLHCVHPSPSRQFSAVDGHHVPVNPTTHPLPYPLILLPGRATIPISYKQDDALVCLFNSSFANPVVAAVLLLQHEGATTLNRWASPPASCASSTHVRTRTNRTSSSSVVGPASALPTTENPPSHAADAGTLSLPRSMLFIHLWTHTCTRARRRAGFQGRRRPLVRAFRAGHSAVSAQTRELGSHCAPCLQDGRCSRTLLLSVVGAEHASLSALLLISLSPSSPLLSGYIVATPHLVVRALHRLPHVTCPSGLAICFGDPPSITLVPFFHSHAHHLQLSYRLVTTPRRRLTHPVTTPRLVAAPHLAVPGFHRLPTSWMGPICGLGSSITVMSYECRSINNSKKINQSKLTHAEGGVANADQSTKKKFNIGTAHKRGGSCQKLLALSPSSDHPLLRLLMAWQDYSNMFSGRSPSQSSSTYPLVPCHHISQPSQSARESMFRLPLSRSHPRLARLSPRAQGAAC